ncbi:AAA family ATPase, partial [Nostoc sp. XA013]|nr:AAA family ATPase [Nostoc sp. XA013]
MAKPPSNRKKAISAASSDSTLPDDQDLEENPGSATITVTAVEVTELTQEEQSDRLLLERKVERAFFEAGKALAQLRDRILYRSTHKTFDEYCLDRFAYNRSRSYQLVDAAVIVDNLQKCPQIVDILPTAEGQVRPMTKLEPQEQQEAWLKAVELAGGKVPTGRIVKNVVQRIMERTKVPNTYQLGEVCQIDFYSLGVTFYELLTGQLPFPTQDILELVHCHIAKPPIPVHELNATIPKPISGIILKLMAKNAEDRYQSAWGIKADLERCAGQLAEMGQINAMSLGLQDVSEQFCIPQKLYGREAQTKALLAAFDRVVRKETFGEICQLESSIENAQFNVELMLVAGYAGVGKTALVQELYKPITAKHGYFISGKFDQFRRNIPYSAIVDALQKLVQQLLGEPDEQVQQWRSRLLTALGSNGQIIVDVIPEVEFIIGKQPPVPEVGATEAQNRFNLTFQRFVRAFCAKEHPLVVFLDDLQWIDSAT